MNIQNSVISVTPYRSRPAVNTTEDMVMITASMSKRDWDKVKAYLEELNREG